MPRLLATALVDIKCHEGFRCVSNVDVFGTHHNGTYNGLPKGEVLPLRYRGAYEEGCPARGDMTSSGECKDFGKGPVGFCWSHNRYESGPDSPCQDPAMCKCVKTLDNGIDGAVKAQDVKNKSAEVEKGSSVVTKTYQVQPEAQCETCSAHNCNRSACDACKNCEYGTKTIMGRTAEGCYDVDSGVAKRERVQSTDGRRYLFKGMLGQDGGKPQTQQLRVIPHFPLWDPGAERTDSELGGAEDHPSHFLKLPYQSRSEPLAREAWIDGYKQAAPRIQRTMDTAAENVKEWGPKANDIDCTQDIQGRITKMKLFRRECKKHQELENSIAPKTPFENNVPDGNGGFIEVNCVRGTQGMCKSLNCYSDDADLNKGIAQLNERAKTCRAAMAMLVDEEDKNGPISTDAEVTAKAGGRLEVPLPPADETQTSAMPISAGLALWTAVGAVSSAQRSFASAAFPDAAAKKLSSSESSSMDCRGTARRGTWEHAALDDFLCPRADLII